MAARTAVVALGGNALAQQDNEERMTEQLHQVPEALVAVVELAREGWHVAVVHGNGPQVGNALVRQELGRRAVPPLPLGALVAATAGWIGYMLQQSLQNALERAGVDRPVATLMTQVLVDPADPAFRQPNKPVGRTMSGDEARRVADEMGWYVAPTRGGWRRVVASPRPLALVEREAIRSLVGDGYVVVAAGGGGTPVYRHPAGGLDGADAVVDKDHAAALLAHDLGADTLLILTDVDRVYVDFGAPGQRGIPRLTVETAEVLLASGELGSGSMAPKVEAAAAFVRSGGRRAVIARRDQGRDAIAGTAGTEIVAQ